MTNHPADPSRRGLLKGMAGVAALASAPLPFQQAQAKADNSSAPYTPINKFDDTTKRTWSACTVNCGSRCPLQMTTRNGQILYVESDDTGTDTYGEDHQVRACLRGRSMRRRVYSPDRLKYPMRRVGKRGEGKFERISWDEAFSLIADNLKRISKEYGNEAIYLNYGTGTLGGTVTKSWPPAGSLIARLMNCYGGYLNHYGDYSTAQIAAGLNYTYGGWASGNSISDVENTKLIVQFGNNPAETRMSGGGITYYLQEAKKRSNARLIIIDPRYTDTALGKEDQWIPIRPGTDAALVNGLAYVLITENLVDQAFLDKYCVGYDQKTLPKDAPANSHYKAYILGEGDDQTPKTPEWASQQTGIPVATIVQLAREIGQAKPCYIAQGWGPQRSRNGENISRAIAMLPILTGNVGIQGGNSGARESSYAIPFQRFPTLSNPVKTSISMFTWTDAILRGEEMTATADGVRGKDKLDAPIKFIWNYASNCLVNQHGDINRTREILGDESRCEMIVVIDNHMTSSAEWADLVLPDLTTSEQMDFATDANFGNMNLVIFCDKVIEPMFECRSIYDICSGIAKALGDYQGESVFDKFTEGRNQEEWLRHIYAVTRARDPSFPSFEEFRKMGIIKRRDPNGHFIAYKGFRDNPKANPLSTPTGKIEIYSQALAEIAATWQLPEGDVITALPEHVSTLDGWDDEKRKELPLQLIGFHYKARTHSTYGNVELLKAANPQEVWIHPLDANSRGIKHGDLVNLKNDYGETFTQAKVTPRIMPGVVALSEGAWYQPNQKGVDTQGSFNVLATQAPSPLAKGNPSHTNLVEIKLLAAKA